MPTRSLAVIILRVLTAVLLISGIAAAAVVRPEKATDLGAGAGTTITVSPNEPAPNLPGVDGEVAAALPPIMRFVEKARGLAYKRPVKVALLGDAPFRRRLLGTGTKPTDKELARVRTQERVLRALGLLEKGVDLQKSSEKLLGAAVAGFYDTKRDDLVVRGDKLTPSVQITLAHELTHALQGQYFNLDRAELDKRDDEASQAFTSVIEGDAVRIQQAYTDQLSPEDQKRAQLEEMGAAGGVDQTTPRVLLAIISFPYVAGPPFAATVAAKGGRERLDKAFAIPPTTSEQILHPDLYLSGEAPKLVDAPKAGGKEIDKGVVGEFGLLLMFDAGKVTIPQQTALTAAAGWGGDRYVAWREAKGDSTCVRANVVMDTPKDATELRTALDALAKERSGLTVAAVGGNDAEITFTSCA